MQDLPTDIQNAITDLNQAWKQYKEEGLTPGFHQSFQDRVIERKFALIHVLTSETL